MLRTGTIIAKTKAAEWALEYKENKQALDYAEALAAPIQCFADILEKELKAGKHLNIPVK